MTRAQMETDAQVVALLEAMAEEYRIRAKHVNMTLALKVACKAAAKALDADAAKRLRKIRAAQYLAAGPDTRF